MLTFLGWARSPPENRGLRSGCSLRNLGFSVGFYEKASPNPYNWLAGLTACYDARLRAVVMAVPGARSNRSRA